jgi:hypothetical protein
MRPAIGLRTFVVVALLGLGLGWGCGRSDLDIGFDPGGSFGIGGSPGGVAGRGGGGQGVGGTPGGGPTPLECGAAFCQPGAEYCCADTTGQATSYCVSLMKPDGCPQGVMLSCVNASDCGPSLRCCLSLLSLTTTCNAACLPGAALELCATSSICRDPTQSCCPLAMGTGVCLPAGISCASIRP